MLVYVANPAYSADEGLLSNVTCRLRSFVSARFAAEASADASNILWISEMENPIELARALEPVNQFYSQFSTLHHFILSSEINLAFIRSSRG